MVNGIDQGPAENLSNMIQASRNASSETTNSDFKTIFQRLNKLRIDLIDEVGGSGQTVNINGKEYNKGSTEGLMAINLYQNDIDTEFTFATELLKKMFANDKALGDIGHS